MPRNATGSRAGQILGMSVMDGEIGVMRKGGFFALTNFTFDVICAVHSPEGAHVALNGYIYRLSSDSVTR